MNINDSELVVLINKFNTLQTDGEKWKWILKYKDFIDIVIYLDNDETFGVVNDDADLPILRFDSYLGYSTGVFSLLEVIGIKCDSV